MKKALIWSLAGAMLLSSNCYAYQQLQKGSYGSDVVALQQELIKQGYLSGTADGDYGNMTVEAVTGFQNANGLEATGIADEQMQEVLFGAQAEEAGTEETSESAAENTYVEIPDAVRVDAITMDNMDAFQTKWYFTRLERSDSSKSTPERLNLNVTLEFGEFDTDDNLKVTIVQNDQTIEETARYNLQDGDFGFMLSDGNTYFFGPAGDGTATIHGQNEDKEGAYLKGFELTFEMNPAEPDHEIGSIAEYWWEGDWSIISVYDNAADKSTDTTGSMSFDPYDPDDHNYVTIVMADGEVLIYEYDYILDQLNIFVKEGDPRIVSEGTQEGSYRVFLDDSQNLRYYFMRQEAAGARTRKVMVNLKELGTESNLGGSYIDLPYSASEPPQETMEHERYEYLPEDGCYIEANLEGDDPSITVYMVEKKTPIHFTFVDVEQQDTVLMEKDIPLRTEVFFNLSDDVANFEPTTWGITDLADYHFVHSYNNYKIDLNEKTVWIALTHVEETEAETETPETEPVETEAPETETQTEVKYETKGLGFKQLDSGKFITVEQIELPEGCTELPEEAFQYLEESGFEYNEEKGSYYEWDPQYRSFDIYVVPVEPETETQTEVKYETMGLSFKQLDSGKFITVEQIELPEGCTELPKEAFQYLEESGFEYNEEKGSYYEWNPQYYSFDIYAVPVEPEIEETEMTEAPDQLETIQVVFMDLDSFDEIGGTTVEMMTSEFAALCNEEENLDPAMFHVDEIEGYYYDEFESTYVLDEESHRAELYLMPAEEETSQTVVTEETEETPGVSETVDLENFDLDTWMKEFHNPWVYDGKNEAEILAQLAKMNDWGEEYNFDADTGVFEGKDSYGDDFHGTLVVEDGRVSCTYTDYYGDNEVPADYIEEYAQYYLDDTLYPDHSNVEYLTEAIIRKYGKLSFSDWFWEMDMKDGTGVATGDEGTVVNFTYKYDHLESGEEILAITFEDGKTLTNDDIRE